MIRIAFLASLLALSQIATIAGAQTVDPTASVIQLRSDCTGLGNCFTTMAAISDPATGWLWNTRTPAPSATDPVLVDVGPGEFDGFTCNGGSDVTLRGAGRERSILKEIEFGIDVVDCDRLSFIDLGSHGGKYGVNWHGGGESTWSNVDMVGTGADGFATTGWNDNCVFPTPEKSLHYIHGSRIRTLGSSPQITVGIWTECSEMWIFGGEILANIDDTTWVGGAIRMSAAADIRVFGSAIRTNSTYDGSLPNEVFGVDNLTMDFSQFPQFAALGKGQFHSHGAIINTSVAASVSAAVNAVGIRSGSAFSHTPATAFVVKASPTGTSTRIRGSNVLSPFLWQSGIFPPQSQNEDNVVTSNTGADIFVETDCTSAGDCNGATAGGNQTHLMIYNDSACAASNPWFNTQTGACRQ